MAFTSPTEDIIVQEGTFAYDLTCSGSISAGQAVIVCGTMQVKPATTALSTDVFGVAAYSQTDGNPIAVYGPGNICRVIISGTSKCTAGDDLYAQYEGKWATGTATAGVTCHALALETQATADGTARVLLV